MSNSKKILLPAWYRQSVVRHVYKHLDWMENAINGEIIGKEFVQNLNFNGNIFELAIRPKQFSPEVVAKYDAIDHTKRQKMIQHDGYKSVVCEHHRDIMKCEDCDIFANATVHDMSTLWDKIRHPIGWIKVRLSIRQIIKQGKRK